MQNTLLLRPDSTSSGMKIVKDFDPTHVKSLLNDTVEVSLTSRPDGLLGDDVPYSVGNDNSIAIVLLVCFVLSMTAISFSRGFLLRQIRNFFYMPRSESDITETGFEVGVQVVLVLQSALVGGVLCYLFSGKWLAADFMYGSQLKVIAIFTAVFVAYFILKKLAYSIVDWVFFSPKKSDTWVHARTFLASAEGILIFPMLLLTVYFDIPLETTAIYILCVIILVKILSFYKCYVIFFQRGRQYVQNFLYFCALEIVPLLALAGILIITGNYLKVIF